MLGYASLSIVSHLQFHPTYDERLTEAAARSLKKVLLANIYLIGNPHASPQLFAYGGGDGEWSIGGFPGPVKVNSKWYSVCGSC